MLSLINSYVCDLKGFEARGRRKYFITFISGYSRYAYVFLLKTKDEAFETFKEYRAEVENQIGRRIKELRSDKGGEYMSYIFDSYYRELRIVHFVTPP